MLAISKLLTELIKDGDLAVGIWETVYMTFLSIALAYLIGLPLGMILSVTDKDGIYPVKWVSTALGIVINIFRSIPFIILMVAFLPVSKFLIGTSLGNGAMIIMLTIAAAPYVARMVESSIKEVDKGVVEAARSMGATNFEIITKVLIPEAKPSLIVGAVISVVTVFGYSAMAGTIGGGGLGKIAITYGHQRSNPDITWTCVFLCVILVQVIQEAGMRVAKRLDRRAKSSN